MKLKLFLIGCLLSVTVCVNSQTTAVVSVTNKSMVSAPQKSTLTGEERVQLVDSKGKMYSDNLNRMWNDLLRIKLNSAKGLEGVKTVTNTFGTITVVTRMLAAYDPVTAIVPTVTVNSGVISYTYNPDKIDILSVYVQGVDTDLSSNQDLKILFTQSGSTTSNVIKTLPNIVKYDRILGLAASSSVPYSIDMDNTPEQRIYAGEVNVSSSVGIQILNLNAFGNWGLKIVF
jgi:hypothetical protein